MSTNQSEPKEIASRLLGYLRGLREDRGAMADLRCALSPVRLPRAWPLLARVGGIGNLPMERIAGFFGYHSEETDQGNVGTTCRRLAVENSSFDGRFRRLLACDRRDEVCDRLRPIVLAAKSKGVKVNYEQLFVDLSYWSPRVKESWAREYWAAAEGEESALPAEVTT
jgi:CRISPR system Cascade subunit CasB